MRWRVMTVTDCGVSRSDSDRPVLAAVARGVYEPVPSVVAGLASSPTTCTEGSVATPASWAVAAAEASASTTSAGVRRSAKRG
ncbi:hypothetical protein D3C72_2080970 [compost metagenome]